LEIRRYKPGEERTIRDVYYSSNHHVVCSDYSAAQIERWAPHYYDTQAWCDHLQDSQPFLAVCNQRIAGFSELLHDGSVDYFYCHHKYQRKGVGTALMQRIEQEARQAGQTQLSLRSSTTAVDFFLTMGFAIAAVTENIVCGTPARQYVMSKSL